MRYTTKQNNGPGAEPSAFNPLPTASLPDLRRTLQVRTGEAWPHREQVGWTEFFRLESLEQSLRSMHLLGPDGQIFLKVENNITSTFKDRSARMQAEEAQRRHCSEITIASCGNAAEAIAVAAFEKGLKPVVFISRDSLEKPDVQRIKERIETGCKGNVIPVYGDYDNCVKRSKKYAIKGGDKVYDANSSGPNAAIERAAYEQIGWEIMEQYARESQSGSRGISAVFVPTGNGTLFTGVFDGIKSWRRAHPLSFQMESPRMIGCTSKGTNPLGPGMSEIKESKVTTRTASLATNEPCQEKRVKQIRYESRGLLDSVREEFLIEAAAKLQHSLDRAGKDLRPLPPASIGVAALWDDLRDKELDRNGVFVIVISGVAD